MSRMDRQFAAAGTEVRELVDEAVRTRSPQVFAGCCGRLAHPDGEAAVQVVNRTLLTDLVARVEQAWRRGWQPAEIVRGARRQFGTRHAELLIDVVAAQMRRYPAASVTAGWQAQLTDLGAQVWWTHDDRHLTAWGERHDVARPAAVQTAVELLVLLTAMPVVAPTGPMPGTMSPPGAEPAAGEIDQRLLDRVRALLAKAESTDFPEEAEAYTTKAQELMTRHRIDHALLAATSGARDSPATRRIAVDNPYEGPKMLLLQVVADANGCRAVWQKRLGLVTVVGFAADLDATELLFTSLLVQATRAMTGAGPRQDGYGRNTTRSFRHSFLTSYAARIGERLRIAAEQVSRSAAAADTSRSLLPVLAARTEAVSAAVGEQFPELTHVSTRVSNRAGWAAGRAAADRAVLHGREAVER